MSCGNFAAVRPKSHNNLILSFLAPRTGALAKAVWDKHPERAMQMQSLAPIPDYRHYSPPPSNCLCNAFYRHLSSRSATGAEINGTGRMAAARLDMFPCCNVMCLWICAFVAEVFFFLFSDCTPNGDSLGVKFIYFFSSLSSCKSCIFKPCLLFCLTRCHMYVVYVWTGDG